MCENQLMSHRYAWSDLSPVVQLVESRWGNLHKCLHPPVCEVGSSAEHLNPHRTTPLGNEGVFTPDGDSFTVLVSVFCYCQLLSMCALVDILKLTFPLYYIRCFFFFFQFQKNKKEQQKNINYFHHWLKCVYNNNMFSIPIN